MRLCLVSLFLFASHSSFQVSCHQIHPLLQIAFCKQYVSALLVILFYRCNKPKAGPYELWGVTGPCSCRSPSNQVTSFTLIMIISHFSKTPCCQTPVIMSLSVHQCTPNSIQKVGIVFCKANEDTGDQQETNQRFNTSLATHTKSLIFCPAGQQLFRLLCRTVWCFFSRRGRKGGRFSKNRRQQAVSSCTGHGHIDGVLLKLLRSLMGFSLLNSTSECM